MAKVAEAQVGQEEPMVQEPVNPLRVKFASLTFTPIRVSALLMGVAAIISIAIMSALLAFAGVKDDVGLVLATGIVGSAMVFGSAIMQLITPEPKDPPNAHQAQLDHDAEMARIQLEKERLRLEQDRIELERHRLATQGSTNVGEASG